MGEVYEAEDLELGAAVALKILWQLGALGALLLAAALAAGLWRSSRPGAACEAMDASPVRWTNAVTLVL